MTKSQVGLFTGRYLSSVSYCIVNQTYAMESSELNSNPSPWHHRDLLVYAFVIKSSQEERKKENEELKKENASEVTTSKLHIQFALHTTAFTLSS